MTTTAPATCACVADPTVVSAARRRPARRRRARVIAHLDGAAGAGDLVLVGQQRLRVDLGDVRGDALALVPDDDQRRGRGRAPGPRPARGRACCDRPGCAGPWESPSASGFLHLRRGRRRRPGGVRLTPAPLWRCSRARVAPRVVGAADTLAPHRGASGRAPSGRSAAAAAAGRSPRAAPPPGFEPGLHGSKGRVLPLHQGGPTRRRRAVRQVCQAGRRRRARRRRRTRGHGMMGAWPPTASAHPASRMTGDAAPRAAARRRRAPVRREGLRRHERRGDRRPRRGVQAGGVRALRRQGGHLRRRRRPRDPGR